MCPNGAIHPSPGQRSCEKIDCINHRGTEKCPFLFSSLCLRVSVVKSLFRNSCTPSLA